MRSTHGTEENSMDTELLMRALSVIDELESTAARDHSEDIRNQWCAVCGELRKLIVHLWDKYEEWSAS